MSSARSAPTRLIARWPLPAGVETVDVNGYPLAFRRLGAGPPLILVHGSFNDFRTWQPQFESFGAHCRVIAPSLRHYYPEKWHGRGADFTITQHADDLGALIDALGYESTHVLGHSRGGAVALTLARRHPRSVAGLILADPRGLESLLPPSPESTRLATELKDLFLQLGRDLRAGNMENAARSFVNSLAGAGAWERRPPELKRMFFDNIATATDTGEAPPLSCADVKRLTIPLLLLTADRSPGRYGEMFAAMRACDSRIATPTVIPNAGHAMHRDNPEAFNAAVIGFLRGL